MQSTQSSNQKQYKSQRQSTVKGPRLTVKREDAAAAQPATHSDFRSIVECRIGTYIVGLSLGQKARRHLTSRAASQCRLSFAIFLPSVMVFVPAPPGSDGRGRCRSSSTDTSIAVPFVMGRGRCHPWAVDVPARDGMPPRPLRPLPHVRLILLSATGLSLWRVVESVGGPPG